MAAEQVFLTGPEVLERGLSPYPLVLGMEVFSSLINRAVAGGYLSGYSPRGRGVVIGQVTHLLFVNDPLEFCKDSDDQMAYLSWILVWFEALSGLRINLYKSSILPVGRVENIYIFFFDR